MSEQFPLRIPVKIVDGFMGPRITKQNPYPWSVCVDELSEFIELPDRKRVFDLVIDVKPSRNAVKLTDKSSRIVMADGKMVWLLCDAHEFFLSVCDKADGKPIYARLEY